MVPDGLLDHLSSLHVVQHGIDVNNNKKYDMAALGESTFAENLGKSGVPEEVTNPLSAASSKVLAQRNRRAKGSRQAVPREPALRCVSRRSRGGAITGVRRLAGFSGAGSRNSRRGPSRTTTSVSLHLRGIGTLPCWRRCEGPGDREPHQPLTSSTRGLDITPVSGSSRRSR